MADPKGLEPGSNRDAPAGETAGETAGAGRRWLLGLFPLVLLAGLIAVFLQVDPTSVLRTAFPPVEELTIERVTLPEPGRMRIHIVNGGPDPVTVAQVQVDEAYWRFEMEGERTDRTIPRLGRATLELNYPWVEGEPHEIALLTSTGLTFTHEIAVATVTPQPNARYLGTFALLGLYAGVIPVILGLLWYPFLRQIDSKWIHFFLSLTIGLLVFLAVDALDEAFEVSEAVPGAFQGVGLIALGVAGALLALRALAGARTSSDSRNRHPALTVAYLIAIGIGLHNLGEGLAIGAAYALGEIALGSFLVIGFALHNTTEGLAIVAPMASERPPLWHLGVLGAIAGVPTILGAWIGGFSYSPMAATLFLALGAGAILQVVIEVGRLIQRGQPGGLFAPLNAVGLGLGLLIMYATALLVVA
jgi:zinc transporter ZupT